MGNTASSHPAEEIIVNNNNKSPGDTNIDQSYAEREKLAQNWLQLTIIVVIGTILAVVILKLALILKKKYCPKKQYLQPLAVAGTNVPALQPMSPALPMYNPSSDMHQQAAALLNAQAMMRPYNMPPFYDGPPSSPSRFEPEPSYRRHRGQVHSFPDVERAERPERQPVNINAASPVTATAARAWNRLANQPASRHDSM